MPYRLDLAQLRPHELKRTLSNAEFMAARPVLATARWLHRPMLAPDVFPDKLELRIAQEEDWDALGASIQHAVQTRAMREGLIQMGFTQVGAFRLEGLPYPRNFFAYNKLNDVFGALYLSDREGPPPYLELISLHRDNSEAAKTGRLGIVTSSASTPEPLDPSPRITWVPTPNASPESTFQLHRNKVLELGRANRKAATVEDFTSAFLDVWNENFASWRERGVLKAEP